MSRKHFLYIIVIVMCLSLLLAVAACGKDDPIVDNPVTDDAYARLRSELTYDAKLASTEADLILMEYVYSNSVQAFVNAIQAKQIAPAKIDAMLAYMNSEQYADLVGEISDNVLTLANDEDTLVAISEELNSWGFTSDDISTIITELLRAYISSLQSESVKASLVTAIDAKLATYTQEQKDTFSEYAALNEAYVAVSKLDSSVRLSQTEFETYTAVLPNSFYYGDCYVNFANYTSKCDANDNSTGYSMLYGALIAAKSTAGASVEYDSNLITKYQTLSNLSNQLTSFAADFEHYSTVASATLDYVGDLVGDINDANGSTLLSAPTSTSELTTAWLSTAANLVQSRLRDLGNQLSLHENYASLLTLRDELTSATAVELLGLTGYIEPISQSPEVIGSAFGLLYSLQATYTDINDRVLAILDGTFTTSDMDAFLNVVEVSLQEIVDFFTLNGDTIDNFVLAMEATLDAVDEGDPTLDMVFHTLMKGGELLQSVLDTYKELIDTIDNEILLSIFALENENAIRENVAIYTAVIVKNVLSEYPDDEAADDVMLILGLLPDDTFGLIASKAINLTAKGDVALLSADELTEYTNIITLFDYVIASDAQPKSDEQLDAFKEFYAFCSANNYCMTSFTSTELSNLSYSDANITKVIDEAKAAYDNALPRLRTLVSKLLKAYVNTWVSDRTVFDTLAAMTPVTSSEGAEYNALVAEIKSLGVKLIKGSSEEYDDMTDTEIGEMFYDEVLGLADMIIGALKGVTTEEPAEFDTQQFTSFFVNEGVVIKKNETIKVKFTASETDTYCLWDGNTGFSGTVYYEDGETKFVIGDIYYTTTLYAGLTYYLEVTNSASQTAYFITRE